MSSSMEENIRIIWNALEDEPETSAHIQKRKYRRLDLERETGLRLSCCFPEKMWELLIEVESESFKRDFPIPKWKGMGFYILQLDVPAPNTWHICLQLNTPEHREVFVNVCSDLAEELIAIESTEQRKFTLLDFIDRWSRFFELYSQQAMSEERQRGLWGELWWMRRLLFNGFNKVKIVDSWKGCECGYYDFDMDGNAVEVKTTISKEPRKVKISNERQLDDKGLRSLCLLVLSLSQSGGDGDTLPELINSVKEALSSDALCLRKLERGLHEAGYIKAHEQFYDASYSVRNEELLKIGPGFPRITQLPYGIGDLQYSLLVGSCSSYIIDTEKYLNDLRESTK
jgi:hypothetical protein